MRHAARQCASVKDINPFHEREHNPSVAVDFLYARTSTIKAKVAILPTGVEQMMTYVSPTNSEVDWLDRRQRRRFEAWEDGVAFPHIDRQNMKLEATILRALQIEAMPGNGIYTVE